MWRASEEAEPLQGNGQELGQQQPEQQQQSMSMLAFARSTTVRRWPLLAVLVSVVLLASSPWLYSQLVPSEQDYETEDPALGLTVEDMIYNPAHVGRDYTLEQAKELLNCTYRRWRQKLKPIAKEGVCPKYFHLIQKDLSPWKEKGVTRENVDSEINRKQAFAKFAIVDGKLYMERWHECFLTRSDFTIWSLLLLLEKFKGQVPDVEFMFNCEDRPRMPTWGSGPEGPGVLFSYNSRSDHLDIPFPDFSLWGWPGLSIHSWDDQRATIMKGSKKKKWSDKVPKAYWTGNPNVGAPHRRELMQCNHNKLTEIHPQDWAKEIATGKKNSDLNDQCTHKYMIYTEGNAWSVSFKYILACGSPVLVISPAFYDFFSRGLEENVAYVPVRPRALKAPELCDAIDEAVRKGDKNQDEYLKIGQTGQAYMDNEVSMDMVYNYMFHLLVEYSKLLKYKPAVADNMHLLSLDHFRCVQIPLVTTYMERVAEILPMNSVPCTMPEVPEGEKPFQGYGFEVVKPF